MNVSQLLLASILLAESSTKASTPEQEQRLSEAASVLEEAMRIPEQAIPQDLLGKSQCVVVLPGLMKGAFIIGARHGKGYISCRKKTGIGWTSPGSVRIVGGSLGLQIGVAESDVILLVMNQKGADRLLSSQFTIGGAAELAAGPVGRTVKAQTDALMTAQILSWSRSRGAFVGVSLQGASLRQDREDNRKLYGRPIENKEIVETDIPPPEAAKQFLLMLNKHSGQK
jgi:lipid-binding SYLF domain-containing protein